MEAITGYVLLYNKLFLHKKNLNCTWYTNTYSLIIFQLEIIAIRNQNNNSFASLDDFEYHVTDECMLKPPAADPDSCGDDQFLCVKEQTCIPIVRTFICTD